MAKYRLVGAAHSLGRGKALLQKGAIVTSDKDLCAAWPGKWEVIEDRKKKEEPAPEPVDFDNAPVTNPRLAKRGAEPAPAVKDEELEEELEEESEEGVEVPDEPEDVTDLFTGAKAAGLKVAKGEGGYMVLKDDKILNDDLTTKKETTQWIKAWIRKTSE